MSYEDIAEGKKILVYLDDGNEIGGTVAEKTDNSLRLTGAARVKEEWVAGMTEMFVKKTQEVGTIEIRAENVIRWRDYPATL
jgi:hypothetical protein